MRTVHCSGHLSWLPCHACPPATHDNPGHACPLPYMPPFHACTPAMHTPCHVHLLPCMHPCHACTPAMHTPCHACPPLPCIHPFDRHTLLHHTCPLFIMHAPLHHTYSPPHFATHTPHCGQNDRRLWKHYLSATTVADGNKLEPPQSSMSPPVCTYLYISWWSNHTCNLLN